MKRVLLLATTTGYQTRAFGEVAERLGVELVFATDRCDKIDDPWQDRAVPIRFYDEDASVSAILGAVKIRPVDGIVVVGDRPTMIAARVAQALGLPGHPPEAAAIARHKQRTRERLRAAGLLVPWFFPFAIDHQPSSRSDLPLRFPCVVKPVALSGSRGVMRADSLASLTAAFERLRAIMRSPDVRAERSDAHETALVEGFIPGREYAVEAVMHHGALHIVAIFDKPDPLDGPFFEETIYLTPSAASAEEQRAIADGVTRASHAIGLTHGPVHAECRVNEQGVFVLEVAARPIGGLCAQVLRVARAGTRESGLGTRVTDAESSIPYEELLLRTALGEDPALYTRESAASGVMMIPIPRRGVFRGAEGVDGARAVSRVTDVRITAKPDQLLVPLPEGSSYLGFIFARADRAGLVDTALRAAHSRLRFAIDAEFPVLTSTQMPYNPSHG